MLLGFTATIGCGEKPAAPNDEVQPIARIQLDTSRVVEVIGLRRWTVDMIQDSLGKYAPNQTLDSAGVATILRQQLHFVDAAVDTSVQVFDENEATQITVAVREPQDTGRVHFLPQTLDTIPRVAEWKAIGARLAGHDSHLLRVVANRHFDGPLRDVIDSSAPAHPVTNRVGYAYDTPEDSVDARQTLEALAKRTSPADFATAVTTLDHSTSLPDRIVAVFVLANFPARDSAWQVLMRAAVGHAQAADAWLAGRAIAGMAERYPRAVAWQPVAPLIHDVLDGTALMSLPSIAGALARTGAGPRDASAYLAGGGEMLVAYLESANPDLNEPAHRLLVTLRGSDLGGDPDPWRAWIRTLSPSNR